MAKKKKHKVTPAERLKVARNAAWHEGFRAGQDRAKQAHTDCIETALVNAESRLRGGYTETVIREVARLLLGDLALTIGENPHKAKRK